MTYRRRNTLRGKDFDFTQPAYYFITLSIEDKKKLLGKIENEKMETSKLGDIVNQTWQAIPQFYPYTKLHAYQAMPDHFHGIIQIVHGNPQPVSISTIINQVKGKITKTAKSEGVALPKLLWQRSFWCKAVWMEHDLAVLERYIIDNPKNYKE